MTIYVSDLTPSLKRAVNPPGVDLYPDAVDGDYEGHLSDSFWELVMWGYITGFTEDNGLIIQDVATPTTDLGRDFQQLIVIVAGLNIIRMLMVNINTLFRAQAGPVEFEQRKAASVLAEVMQSLERKLKSMLQGLTDSNDGGNTTYFDVVALRAGIDDVPTFWGS